jgi:TrmH family RNA methyltransferase
MLTKGEIKKIKALGTKKFRDQYGQFVAEGVKNIEEALASRFRVEQIYIQGSLMGDASISRIQSQAAKKGVEVIPVKEREYEQISHLTTAPGILAIVAFPKDVSIEGRDQYLVIDGVQDPGNMGTILRTADWFGIGGVICGAGCVDIYNPKVVQATMGSLFRVPIMQDQDLVDVLEVLREGEYEVFAATLDGATKWNIPKKWALIMGSESHGIREPLKKHSKAITIQGRGSAESLNVGVATGILLNTFLQ